MGGGGVGGEPMGTAVRCSRVDTWTFTFGAPTNNAAIVLPYMSSGACVWSKSGISG